MRRDFFVLILKIVKHATTFKISNTYPEDFTKGEWQ